MPADPTTCLDPTVVDDPAELGLPRERVADLVERAGRDVGGDADGALPAAQLAVARHGRLACHVTWGAPPDARFPLFSVTKAITAGAVWLEIGAGRLHPDHRVADHLPSFAANGKGAVTIEQLLTHTAGFPQAPLGPGTWERRDQRVTRFEQWRLNWEPGTRMEYHPSSAHWVLAELVARSTGRDHRDVIAEDLCEPLGLTRMRVGATTRHPDEWSDVQDVVLLGTPPSPEELEAVTGMPGIDLGEVTDDAVLSFNDDGVRALGVPGGGGIATAGDVALYYQALLHNVGGLWDDDVLADATSRIRCTLVDPMLGVAANRSLGLVIAGADGQAPRRGFGKTVSGRAFGHLGAGAQVAWADPATGISFCYVTNGHDRHLLREGMRINSLNNRAGALVEH